MRQKLARLLAWVVTIGVLAYLFTSISPAEVLRALRNTSPWAVPALALLVFPVYVADSLAIWKTFAWFVARLSLREVLVVRGATYILALVNYALGQGAIVYFVNRTRGIPVMRGAAAVLLVMGTNLLLLLFLSSFGLLVAPSVPRFVAVLVPIAYTGLLVYVVLVVRPPRWLTSRPIFDVLLGAGLGGYGKALLVRLPHLAALVLFSYVSLRVFGVAVPLGYALLCLPAVYFVAVLPISVQGLGPTQYFMVQFFARFAPGGPEQQQATVIAASIASQAVAFVVQAGIGLICLRSHLARKLENTEVREAP